MRQAAAQTDNGISEAGICPKCMVLPVKAGAEALDRTDDLAQAWLFAADAGASVIVSVTADLGYSSFMRQAVDSIWKRGVLMVEASNDFDSTDHQGGMFWPHVLPGNGLVVDTPKPATTTFRERSNYTSWGTHNMFSAATSGGTTSESTPTVGGVAALLLSYGKTAAAQHHITSPLTNAEAVQVLRATASDIDDPSLPWPGKPGWDLQYGYGRPNVWKAMQAVSQGNIPPVAWFDSPDWYSLYDPTTTSTVPVTGHVEAPRSSGYTWKLEFAPGAEPTDAAFIDRRQRIQHRPDRRPARQHQPGEPAVVVLERGVHLVDDQVARDERAVHGDACGCGHRCERPRRRGAAGDRRPSRCVPAGRLPQAHRSRRREPAGTRRPPGHGTPGQRLR